MRAGDLRKIDMLGSPAKAVIVGFVSGRPRAMLKPSLGRDRP
jgi:hypothetical protein